MDLNQTGIFISTLRKQSNMTQRELADKIGVTDKAVSRWETGKGFPDVALLPSLAEVLCTSISELVMGEKLDEKKTVEIMDKAVVNTINTLERSRRAKRERLLAKLLKCTIVLAVIGVIIFILFAQIPLTRIRSINPQIVLNAETHRDQTELIMNAFLLDNIHFVSRELLRDDERVTVIYFYPSQTLIKRFAEIVISDSIVNFTRLAYRANGEDVKAVEVYYLPENLQKIDQCSDDWYDLARFNGILIWSGLV